MKIWLVNDHHCGDCGRIIGAFDSHEKALAHMDRGYDIEEIEVQ